MSDKTIDVTNGNFESDVLKSEKPVLVDFWAPWCGPCKAIGPVVEELAETFNDRMVFAKCNVDDNAVVAGKYGIRSIPTLLFFKNGEVVETINGAVGKSKVSETIQNVLADKPSSQPFMVQ